MFNKYPKVNYVGNKEKIASWICEYFPTDTTTLFDAFSMPFAAASSQLFSDSDNTSITFKIA